MARARADRDYYGILGLTPEATEDEIRRAYRRLALQWHPDRNAGDRSAEERFKAISEAYAVLIDPAKRRAYDGARAAGATGGFGPSREDLFRDLFADPRASAIFEELARELSRLGVSVERRDFRETLFGGRAVVSGRVVVITPQAPARLLLDVAGAVLRAAWRSGRAVPGSHPARPRGLVGLLAAAGRRLLGLGPGEDAGGRDVVVPLVLTAAEAAQGTRKRVMLRRNDRDEAVVVTVPRGVAPGTRLRLRGKGRPGPSGRPGDAYLVVDIAERGTP